MAISGCSNVLVVTALVTLVLLPAQYYIPELYQRPDKGKEPRPLARPLPTGAAHHWLYLEIPVLDLILTVSLFLLAVITYLFDWIQRKLMERRLIKLNAYLCECVSRLRGWDARQEQLEATLRMVQNATSEYNLLLYLLLRRGRAGARACKGLDDFSLLSADERYEPPVA